MTIIISGANLFYVKWLMESHEDLGKVVDNYYSFEIKDVHGRLEIFHYH